MLNISSSPKYSETNHTALEKSSLTCSARLHSNAPLPSVAQDIRQTFPIIYFPHHLDHMGLRLTVFPLTRS